MKNAIYRLTLFTVLLLGACKSEKKETFKTLVGKEQKEQVEKQIFTFNYASKKPVNGKLKGVVELGASGFNSFIINVDKDNNWEIKQKEFGKSLIIEGKTNANEVNSKLREYIQSIIEFGVNRKDVHFVMSSGAKNSAIAKQIEEELEQIGYFVNDVTAEEEGVYGAKAALPEDFKNNAFMVDIGSGNTKISYYEDGKITSKEGYGSKYFQKEIADDKVYKSIKESASKIPKEMQSLCFIIGGVPYQMAKSLRKNKERFTVLNPNIEVYDEVVKKKGQKVKSGLNIFKAIADETNCKRFIFDWDANFSIGFLLSLDEKNKSEK